MRADTKTLNKIISTLEREEEPLTIHQINTRTMSRAASAEKLIDGMQFLQQVMIVQKKTVKGITKYSLTKNYVNQQKKKHNDALKKLTGNKK